MGVCLVQKLASDIVLNFRQYQMVCVKVQHLIQSFSSDNLLCSHLVNLLRVFLTILLTDVIIMLKSKVTQCSYYKSWCHVDRLTAPGICANYHLVIIDHSNRDSNTTDVYVATTKLITSGTIRSFQYLVISTDKSI